MARITRTRQELIEDLYQLDRSYAALLQNSSSEQLNWRPAIDAWSVTQCIQHVSRVNSIYLTPIKAAIAKGQPSGVSEGNSLHTAGWFSSVFLKSVSPQGKAKLRSPRIGRPSAEPSDIKAEEVLQILLGTHQEIREILTGRNQPSLNRIRFKNPFVPVLHFTVASGILVMVAHGGRHLLQAQRLCEMQVLPKASVGKTA
jgi:DinB superfamily